MKEKFYNRPNGITIRHNGRFYVISKDGKPVAHCFSMMEAEEYAKEYGGYKGEGLTCE